MTVRDKVEKALSEIRPFLERDGGGINLVSVVDGVVTIQWLGYCQTCSKQLFTLNGVTEVIKRHAPEVTAVEEL